MKIDDVNKMRKGLEPREAAGAIAEWRKARPIKIENALRKIAKTWSNFLEQVTVV